MKDNNRLQSLKRVPGNIQPKQPYNKENNIDKVAKNLEETTKKRKEKSKINNQKNSLKFGDDVKNKLEAQKQIEGISFDYEFLNLLLDRNASNFSQKDKAKYNILIEE